MIKTKALILLAIITFATASTILLAQGQNYLSIEEKIVDITEKAAQQVDDLIVSINSDEEALEKIETADLLEQLQNNITLHEEGLTKLDSAKEALTNNQNTIAIDSAIDAQRIFREVYSSINIIMQTSGIEKPHLLLDCLELQDAITRELNRIDSLRELLETDAPQEIVALLDEAQELLKQANDLLLEEKLAEAKTLFNEAKADIIHVYQYLKTIAESSNAWRLTDYCQQLQERARERFRYGHEQNVDLTDTLATLGYQSETEFMNALSNQIQNAEDQQNIQSAITLCQQLSQMVKNMENAVNQEITRQQGQKNGPGYGGNITGNGSANGSGSGTMGEN